MDKKDYITIQEYAKLKGISTQAVYKQLTTKLTTYVYNLNGHKVLNIAVLQDKNGNALNEVDNQVTNQVDNHINQVDNQVTNQNTRSRNNDIAFLKSQLQEKDKQINQLQKTFDKQLAEKDKQIDNLHKLLANEQQLQGHQQLLLKPRIDKKPLFSFGRKKD